MEAQFAEHKTEPNSGLGKAISYLLRHWTKLTLFLRSQAHPWTTTCRAGTEKSDSASEQCTLLQDDERGAVGDLFMSLIHTCELNKVNPFEYLTELLRHPAEIMKRPAEWMPWNYRKRWPGLRHRRPPDLLVV